MSDRTTADPIEAAAPDPDERDLGSADHTHVTGRGFALLGRGIREQRFLFSLSVIGSILYGAMTDKIGRAHV